MIPPVICKLDEQRKKIKRITLSARTLSILINSTYCADISSVAQYDSIKGGGETYGAAQYGADYLYAVVLTGVPAGTTFSASFRPFISYDGVTTYKVSAATEITVELPAAVVVQ